MYENASGRWNVGTSRCIFLSTDIFYAAQMLLGILSSHYRVQSVAGDGGAQFSDSLL